MDLWWTASCTIAKPSSRAHCLTLAISSVPWRYPTRNFYQVMPISEILFAVPIWPAERNEWLSDDPQSFLINRYGWGM